MTERYTMAYARTAKFLIAILALFGLAASYAITVKLLGNKVYQYPDLAGPIDQTSIAAYVPTSWRAYDSGSPSRLAVLLTDPDSSWLGLAHTLKSFGVPFRVTTDVSVALRHKVVLIYPTVSGQVLSGSDLKAIAAHPRRGGYLIGVNVLGGGLNKVFGFTKVVESRSRFLMKLHPATSPLLSEFTHKMEQTVSLGNPQLFSEIIGTLGYAETDEKPLAVYEDGSAAIAWRSYGGGKTFAFGFDIGDFFFRAHHARHYSAHRSYVNAFEPSADVIARLIRNIYLEGNPDAVLVGTVPEGRRLSVMFTYDVDAGSSYEYMVTYAELLRAAGIRGTFNIQTKYVQDFNDAILLDAAAIQNLQALVRLGMEISSHSVAHSRQFSTFPIGRGNENYPDYRPIVLNRRKTRTGTILGELRVSKFLLENLGAVEPVVSFRSGYLAYSNQLPQALAATGYRFNSSMTANNALTHLPFRLNYDRKAGQETDIFEIPVTIEDEKSPEMGQRVDDAVTLAKEISRFGGSFVILTHPNMLGHKIEFHKSFIAAVKDWTWFGSISEFGRWWSARDVLEVDVFCQQKVCKIDLDVPQPINGLALRFPQDCEFQDTSSPDVSVRPTGGGVVLNRIRGKLTLRCSRPSSTSDTIPFDQSLP